MQKLVLEGWLDVGVLAGGEVLGPCARRFTAG